MSFDIAIVGLANRFPGAKDKKALWEMLAEKRHAFETLDEDRLRAAGVSEKQLADPSYVRVASKLDDIEHFDAAFFNIPAREAMVLDPQHRLFLECVWEAMEDAGTDPRGKDIGVFAGSSLNAYLIHNLACNPMMLSSPTGFMSLVGNEKDYLATRVAYKLDLHGPAVTVQTACSTSMVAVHMAAQSLMLGECDMAVAGGVSLRVPQDSGYTHADGLPFSKDGSNRSFDAEGNGTVFGSGAGVVVLKTLEAAQEDGDDIYAVIRASAMNNDGSRKVGFTAPSTDGQIDVIERCAALAEVKPGDISYVEAHATATPLGDPIEISALGEVYGVDRKSPCRIGSIKSNVGHMETAAGVAGLIKTALMLRNKTLLPSVGFSNPNPNIDFVAAGVEVQTEAEAWPAEDGKPRLAGVSSMGMGGTNVHVILEEAPEPPAITPSEGRTQKIYVLSGKSEAAVEDASTAMADWLDASPQVNGDMFASNLQRRRAHLEVRQAVVADSLKEAKAAFRRETPEHLIMGTSPEGGVDPVFAYCGGGAQYPGMMADLFDNESVFQSTLETCAELFEPIIGESILAYLGQAARSNTAMVERMQQPDIMFPALFSVQHAMGELLTSWGVTPSLLMGHSNGEYAAAVRAGVMSVETAVTLVGTRSTLMLKMPEGSMISVPAPADSLVDIAKQFDLSIGADNALQNTALSGELHNLEAAKKALCSDHGFDVKDIHVKAALHSHLTDDIADAFEQVVREQSFNAPEIPWISTVTGGYIDQSKPLDPGYWVDHLRQTVQFRKAAELLISSRSGAALIDMGPGRVVGDLLRQNASDTPLSIVQTARGYSETAADDGVALTALAKMWALGVDVDWDVYGGDAPCPKLDLPHYAWQRQRYWVEPLAQTASDAETLDDALAAQAVAPVATAEDVRPNVTSPYVAAKTETEQRQLKIWQKFFGISKIGVADDFIELGGTSLLATEVVNAINAEFAIKLELGAFLEAKTISQISVEVDKLAHQTELKFMAEALAEIEGKSDEELKELLSATS